MHTETGSAALLPPLITRTIWALGKTNTGAGAVPPPKTRTVPPGSHPSTPKPDPGPLPAPRDAILTSFLLQGTAKAPTTTKQLQPPVELAQPL